MRRKTLTQRKNNYRNQVIRKCLSQNIFLGFHKVSFLMDFLLNLFLKKIKKKMTIIMTKNDNNKKLPKILILEVFLKIDTLRFELSHSIESSPRSLSTLK